MNLRLNFAAAVAGLTALTLAGASQASTTVIPGLYNTGTGADYLSVMRANLAILRTALGCT